MKKILLLLINSVICISALATPLKDIEHSHQMLVVITPNWDATTGNLYLFEKEAKTEVWKSVGKVIPVTVGKHGMAWDNVLQLHSPQDSVKKEGDGKTPVGVYKLGPFFGFTNKSHFKGNYFPLTNSTICVDDAKSVYYNQIIDAEKVPTQDWNSAEQMRQIPLYHSGIVIQYNQDQPIKYAGSCIFMHIWRNPSTGTAGCVVMDNNNLIKVLSWLNEEKHPVIALMPSSVYKTLKMAWKLPQLG